MTIKATKGAEGPRTFIFCQQEDTDIKRAVRGDDQGRVILSPSSTVQTKPASDIVTLDDQAIAAAGTAEVLSVVSIPCRAVSIQALPDNTGIIYIGDVNVSATRCFVALSAGDYIEIAIDDLQKLWADASVNGEGFHRGYLA